MIPTLSAPSIRQADATAAAQAAIADYEVQLKNAQIALHRAEQLQQAGVQTQEALDNATTNADSLKAKIELAKQQVAAAESVLGSPSRRGQCTIRAPFAGIVVSKRRFVGEMVRPFAARLYAYGHCTIGGHEVHEIEVDVTFVYCARPKTDSRSPRRWTLIGQAIPSKVRTVIRADRQ